MVRGLYLINHSLNLLFQRFCISDNKNVSITVRLKFGPLMINASSISRRPKLAIHQKLSFELILTEKDQQMPLHFLLVQTVPLLVLLCLGETQALEMVQRLGKGEEPI